MNITILFGNTILENILGIKEIYNIQWDSGHLESIQCCSGKTGTLQMTLSQVQSLQYKLVLQCSQQSKCQDQLLGTDGFSVGRIIKLMSKPLFKCDKTHSQL